MTLSISRRQRRLRLARRYLLYSSSTKLSAMRESWSGLFKNTAALWLFVLLSRHLTSVAHTFHLQNFLLNLVRRLKICLLLYFSLTTLVAIFFSIYVLRVFINQMVGTFDYLKWFCLCDGKRNRESSRAVLGPFSQPSMHRVCDSYLLMHCQSTLPGDIWMNNIV